MDYTLGLLLGRLLFTYILVWFVIFVFSKANYRLSTQRLHSRNGFIAIGIVFLLPLLAQLGNRM